MVASAGMHQLPVPLSTGRTYGTRASGWKRIPRRPPAGPAARAPQVGNESPPATRRTCGTRASGWKRIPAGHPPDLRHARLRLETNPRRPPAGPAARAPQVGNESPPATGRTCGTRASGWKRIPAGHPPDLRHARLRLETNPSRPPAGPAARPTVSNPAQPLARAQQVEERTFRQPGAGPAARAPQVENEASQATRKDLRRARLRLNDEPPPARRGTCGTRA